MAREICGADPAGAGVFVMGGYFKPGGELPGLYADEKTVTAIQIIAEAFNANQADSGTYFSDNLFTVGRNLGFLSDERFINAVEKALETTTERSIVWRTHVLTWAAFTCLKLPGDFVECGCYCGKTAQAISEYVRLDETDKRFFIYDVFENPPDARHGMADHSKGLYAQVKQRLSPYKHLLVTQGSVPEVLEDVSPDAISFMHIDMNSVSAELGALHQLFDRVVKGGIIVFDDYGWAPYRAQKAAEDRFMEERGYKIVELPTGQGMMIKL